MALEEMGISLFDIGQNEVHNFNICLDVLENTRIAGHSTRTYGVDEHFPI